MDLLAKNLLASGTEKVKVVGSRGKEIESDFEKKVNYFENQMRSFWANVQGYQGWNYQWDNYYDKYGSNDHDQGNKKSKNDKSSLYVPPRKHDQDSNSSRSLKWKI